MTRSDIAKRLGWKPHMTARISRLPENLRANLAPCVAAIGPEPVWHLSFVSNSGDIARVATEDAPHYRRGQHFWVAYPKKSSGVQTDIDRDHGWEPLRTLDLHAVTQISISDTWSALRLRYRDEIKSFTRTF